ncbi:MAG: hypothetical protein L0H79_15925 [Intrasporangium sp.]|uniref:hypothetical protein n=1 Tax=Intrasporangium sp. TaxID=1925024 RepID=UPI002649C41E|nr:hypothetical protein [Intrasporangium sp.]MDN5797225.1 hypothetical protein [Intrasporangium sp.]
MPDPTDLEDYLNACRARVESQVAFFREFADVVSRVDVEAGGGLEPMLESLEGDYFNNLVIVLDAYFSGRLPDSRPAGPVAVEVSALRASLVDGEGEMLPDAAATSGAGRSVLGLQAGDSIRLTAQSFARLADAYFAEIDRLQLS